MTTREEEVILNCFTPEIKRLEDFYCYNFAACQTNAERVKTLFSLLNLSYLNNEEESSIANICAKFSDIFLLPGDKLNIMNLYEQNIHIKPNTSPVFCKPYRLPYSQKTEIDRQIKEMLTNDILKNLTQHGQILCYSYQRKQIQMEIKNGEL